MERLGMFTGRRTTEAIGGQETIVRHWTVISADGLITTQERTEHTVLLGRQSWLLMAIDVWDKWGTRLKRRGLDAQAMRALQRDHLDLERLRPQDQVLFDPYGAMAAD